MFYVSFFSHTIFVSDFFFKAFFFFTLSAKVTAPNIGEADRKGRKSRLPEVESSEEPALVRKSKTLIDG